MQTEHTQAVQLVPSRERPLGNDGSLFLRSFAMGYAGVVPGIGALIGLVSFAQVLSWLFKRYHDFTVALLTGFMVGSLHKIWPWKKVLVGIKDSHSELIPTVEQNVLPSLYQ